jgi:hypothetical protein
MRGRRTLRSASTSQLSVPSVRLSTGDPRAFAVADPHIWNSMPADITAFDSLPAFRRRLKTHLFHHSYPDGVLRNFPYRPWPSNFDILFWPRLGYYYHYYYYHIS